MEIKWKLSKGRYIGEPAVLGHAQDLVGSMQQYRKGGGDCHWKLGTSFQQTAIESNFE